MLFVLSPKEVLVFLGGNLVMVKKSLKFKAVPVYTIVIPVVLVKGDQVVLWVEMVLEVVNPQEVEVKAISLEAEDFQVVEGSQQTFLEAVLFRMVLQAVVDFQMVLQAVVDFRLALREVVAFQGVLPVVVAFQEVIQAMEPCWEGMDLCQLGWVA